MKYLSLILTVLFCSGAVAQQEPQQVCYNIRAWLHDSTQTIEGFVRIRYINQSSTPLNYIGIQLWPNAYKSDRTAFAVQDLQQGNTKFYFSNPSQRGYINQLDLRVNDQPAYLDTNAIFQDSKILNLAEPLQPGDSLLIETPFYVKLPYAFSGFGFDGEAFFLKNWFPKIAQYDELGWRLMPYLQQTNGYHQRADYQITFTLPDNYAVAASGVVETPVENDWNLQRAHFTWQTIKQRFKKRGGGFVTKVQRFPASSGNVKTIQFSGEQLSDFVIMADKRWRISTDSLQIRDQNLKLQWFVFSTTNIEEISTLLKSTLPYYEHKFQSIPLTTLRIVETEQNVPASYTAGVLTFNAKRLKYHKDEWVAALNTIWLNDILVNRNAYPWINDGLSGYYAHRFLLRGTQPLRRYAVKYEIGKSLLETYQNLYGNISYNKPSIAYKKSQFNLVQRVGVSEWLYQKDTSLIDETVNAFYKVYTKKHGTSFSFKSAIDSISGVDQQPWFSNLGKGMSTEKKFNKIKPVLGSSFKNDQYYIGIVPLAGYNLYDGLMPGLAIHNYTLPLNRFQFIALPMYGTKSKQWGGTGRVSYMMPLNRQGLYAEGALTYTRFTENNYTDGAHVRNSLGYQKIAPGIRLVKSSGNDLSSFRQYLDVKALFIKQEALQFAWDSTTVTGYSIVNNSNAYSQISYVAEDDRKLYPYKHQLKWEKGKAFSRLSCELQYFFNYPMGGGVQTRFFAGKFFNGGGFSTRRYHFTMSGAKGNEDFLYQNAFLGRNEQSGFYAQQIMMRDGGFKVRTDLLSNKLGVSDNWLTALNLTSTLHPRLPVKLFLDIGSSGTGWRSMEDDQPSILYDAGLQLSLFRNTLNVYVPLLYSKAYRNYFESTPGNNFWQRMAFSIDVHNIGRKKLLPILEF